MNCKIAFLHLVFIFFVIQLTNSQPITKVLQNGNSNYEGCGDSHTHSQNPDINYGDNPYLLNKNCQG